jgi:hypothetical protein
MLDWSSRKGRADPNGMLRIFACLLLFILTGSTLAFAAPAKEAGECLVEIEDVSRFEGPCTFERDAAGDLTVWPGTESREPLARLVRGEWTIEGSWRDPAGTAPALTKLGDGWVLNKCWHGERALICAWPPGSRPHPVPAEYLGVWAVDDAEATGR